MRDTISCSEEAKTELKKLKKKIKKNVRKIRQTHHFADSPEWEGFIQDILKKPVPLQTVGRLHLETMLRSSDDGHPQIFLAYTLGGELCVGFHTDSMISTVGVSWSRYLVAPISFEVAANLKLSKETILGAFKSAEVTWVAQFNPANGVLVGLFSVQLDQIPPALLPEDKTLLGMSSQDPLAQS